MTSMRIRRSLGAMLHSIHLAMLGLAYTAYLMEHVRAYYYTQQQIIYVVPAVTASWRGHLLLHLRGVKTGSMIARYHALVCSVPGSVTSC